MTKWTCPVCGDPLTKDQFKADQVVSIVYKGKVTDVHDSCHMNLIEREDNGE